MALARGNLMRPNLIFLFLTLLIFTSSGVLAGPVTWEFAGEITSVRDDGNILAGQVTVGSPFSGVFTFESTTSNRFPTNPNSAIYRDVFSNLIGSVSGIPINGPVGANSISIVDASSTSPSDFFGISVPVDLSGSFINLQIFLTDSSGTILSSDNLLLDPPSLERFDINVFMLRSTEEIPLLQLEGHLTSLTPEPSTLLLLVVGAIFIGKKRHR